MASNREVVESVRRDRDAIRASAVVRRWLRPPLVVCMSVFLVVLGLSGTARASTGPHARGHHHVASGTVVSVNGSTASGSCGTAGTAGSFTLTTPRGTTLTIDVTATTTYADPGVPNASFADVCVGGHAAAAGPRTSSTITAAKVFVSTKPKLSSTSSGLSYAFGTVTSVSRGARLGSCGTAGAAGSFTLSTVRGAETVDVTTTTTYADPGVPNATFADVCAGDHVGAAGTDAFGVLSASHVFVVSSVPKATVSSGSKPSVASGTVATVNGSAASGTCGTAGAAGSFTLSPVRGAETVHVTTTTRYTDPGVTSPSFADVCVGDHVSAVGTSAWATLTATKVFVSTKPKLSSATRHPPTRPRLSSTAPASSFAYGTVASVNGSAASGTCGTAGAAGSFTLSTPRGAETVYVTTATSYTDPGVTNPSFADVCLGKQAAAVGSDSSSTLAATRVFVVADAAPASGWHAVNPSLAGPGQPGSSSTPDHGEQAGQQPSRAGSPGGPAAPQAKPVATTLSGVATSIGPNSLVVTTQIGQKEPVEVTGATRYTGPDGRAAWGALAQGDVIHATGTSAGGTFTATAIDFAQQSQPGPQPAPAASHPAAQSPAPQGPPGTSGGRPSATPTPTPASPTPNAPAPQGGSPSHGSGQRSNGAPGPQGPPQGAGPQGSGQQGSGRHAR